MRVVEKRRLPLVCYFTFSSLTYTQFTKAAPRLRVYKVQAYLYGAVEVPRKAILNEQSCEVEYCQKQCFELSIVRTVTHQQPWHVLHCLACVAQDAIEAIQQIHPMVQLTLLNKVFSVINDSIFLSWLVFLHFAHTHYSRYSHFIIRTNVPAVNKLNGKPPSWINLTTITPLIFRIISTIAFHISKFTFY